MKVSSDAMLIAAAVAAGLLVAWYSKQAVTAAAQAVNPVNPDNVINKAAQAVTGNDNKKSSIGTKIYDWLHPDFTSYNPNGTVKPAAAVASAIK